MPANVYEIFSAMTLRFTPLRMQPLFHPRGCAGAYPPYMPFALVGWHKPQGASTIGLRYKSIFKRHTTARDLHHFEFSPYVIRVDAPGAYPPYTGYMTNRSRRVA